MSKRWTPFLLGAVLLVALACQVDQPRLGPNVELLDTERQQQDDFVALQKPLEAPEDANLRAICTREVQANQTGTAASMDQAIQTCMKKRSPSPDKGP